MPNVRGRREGTLFCRSRDNRWVAMVSMPDGRRRSASDPSKDVAVGLLRDLIDQRDRSVTEDPRRLRVGPFLLRWIERVRPQLAPATWRKHESVLRVHVVPALGHRLLSQLSVADVEAFLAQRNDLDPQTRRHFRATLRRALADGYRDGLVTRNVAALAAAPKMRKDERTYLTAAQARQIIEEARDERYWPLWVLILTTGLRVSEALGLAWSDVDLGGSDGSTISRLPFVGTDDAAQRSGVRSMSGLRAKGHARGSAAEYGVAGPTTGGSIRVRHQLVRVNGQWGRGRLKTRQSRRDIELVPQAVEALTEQRRRQDAERGDYPQPIDGLVFTTQTGQPVHSTNVLPSWYATLRRLGLPRVTSHDLRHSAASIMLTGGVPLPVIANILGHSSIRVTADLYAHIGVELKREAVAKLAEALR